MAPDSHPAQVGLSLGLKRVPLLGPKTNERSKRPVQQAPSGPLPATQVARRRAGRVPARHRSVIARGEINPRRARPAPFPTRGPDLDAHRMV